MQPTKTLREQLKRCLPPFIVDGIKRVRQPNAKDFRPGLSGPWTGTYHAYKLHLLCETLNNAAVMDQFRQGTALPPGYGIGIDERCVEYPWLLAGLPAGPQNLLDAGSTLNFDFIVEQPVFQGKRLDILTLAPESNCYWHRGISYLYADLRDIPIRDAFYDAIACISTLEHIGCDNSALTHRLTDRENRPEGFVPAMQELRRVLKPGGTLLLTVPFGRYHNYVYFQQFDAALLARAIQTFGATQAVTTALYRYTAQGWNVASAAECADCQYVEWIMQARRTGQLPQPLPIEPDMAVAARAVACVRLLKA